MENAFSNFAERLLDFMRRAIPVPGGSALDAEFNTRALELFALQYQHNPAYQRICTSRNVSPERISSWREMPFVPTEAFKELELTSIPPGHRSAVFHSSGTTGQRPRERSKLLTNALPLKGGSELRTAIIGTAIGIALVE